MIKNKLLCSFICLSAGLIALPQDPTALHGEVTFIPSSSSQLEIRAGKKAIIEWKSFSIAEGEMTSFILPSPSSVVLNRVTSGIKSEILGYLQSNGSVYLINPAGILIGKEGLIQAHQFLASTLDLPNEQFLNNGMLRLQGREDTSIIHLGTIDTTGDVYLLAPQVTNEGKILAPTKSVFLGAGRDVLLKLGADSPLYVRPELDEQSSCTVDNKGFIQAVRAEIISGGGPRSLAIFHSGHLDALNISSQNGRIFLCAEQGSVISSGTLEAITSINIIADTLDLQKGGKVFSKGNVSLQSNKLLTHSGTISAENADISVKNEGPFIHTGLIDAINSVTLHAPKFLNGGSIKAGKGGKISIDIQGSSIETASAFLSAEAGSITHHAGTYFSSGYYCTGTTDPRSSGGTIELFANHINLVDAHLDASGLYRPGKISVGKLSETQASHLFLSPTTLLKSHATKNNLKGIINLAPTVTMQAPTNLCATSAGAACTFSSIGEFINPNLSSSGFGTVVLPLSTGNVVITNPTDDFAANNAGAVYLFNGTTGALIATLTGSNASDRVSSLGVVALTNGNYVVSSPLWDNGATADVGAATWGSGTSGITGTITASNSLIGSSTGDAVSFPSVTALTNGNYVVSSSFWDNGATADVGAATWGSGTSGITGTITASNSLIGSSANDRLCSQGVTALTNGNYVVGSPNWDDGGTVNVGAATWGSGTAGITGTITASNSLIGSSASDFISSLGITALTNGNYVVSSSDWYNGGTAGVGAATWGSGTTGITGTVTTSNSLVGSSANDQISSGGVTALTNGNYVVSSPEWDNGGTADVGAATWGSGTLGIAGTVSTANSLVGSSVNDLVSSQGVTALTNGNYVVRSPSWDNGGTADVGAATWGSGTTGVTGTVTASNSLVGSTAADTVSAQDLTALTNGNYVVSSPDWDNGGTVDAGAATWGSGTTGITGTITASNSLVGSSADDFVSLGGVTALTNGHYVVKSPQWDNAGIVNTGAATWGSGTTGITGTVTTSNSLVGSTALDQVSSSGVTALTNGNYVVRSAFWNDGGTSAVGAATWGSGTSGVTGTVTTSNSLVGSTTLDRVSSSGVTALTNGNYVVRSSNWNNGGTSAVGAATWGSGLSGITGTVSSANSLIGTTTSDQVSIGSAIDASTGCYAVSSPLWDNGATTDAGAVTLGSASDGITGTVSSGNSFVRTTASTGLSGVVYNSAANSLVMPFKTENNGRVFFGLFPVISPPSAVIHIPSRGLVDFRLALSETFQLWGPFLLGGLLNEDPYAPYLTYKNVDHKEFPSLFIKKQLILQVNQGLSR